MSTNIDERVVKMEFDESGFTEGAEKAISILDKLKDALNLKGATTGLTEVQKAASEFNMDGVSNALENSKSGFSAFEAFATGVFLNLGATVSNFALNKLSQIPQVLTKGVTDGFQEYQMQMGSIQTILSNTRDAFNQAGVTNEADQIDIINDRLNELNKYADDTIYNFSQMTRNIGLFTAAGVDLDTSVTAIKGLSNLAAVSGADANNASRAMYQMSQAMSTGVVKLMDWNSLVNAGMGGQLFQDEIKRVAKNHGIAVDQIIAQQGSFRESLSKGWLTADIFNEALQHLTYTYEEEGDAAWEAGMAELQAAGYSEEASRSIMDLGRNATQAATKVRTWSQLWDTVGEAIGSGWTQTWQTIVGDFLEATDLFTWFSERISAVVSASADARNSVLQQWAQINGGKGRESFVNTLQNLYEIVEKPLLAIARAFSNVFGISAEQLYNITTAIAAFTSSLVMSDEVATMFEYVMTDIFTVLHSILGVVGNLVRVIVGIGEVIWTVVSPALEGLAIGFALIVDPIAKASDFILGITDILQHFAQKGLDLAITKILKGFEKIDSFLGELLDNMSPYLNLLNDFGNRIGRIITTVYHGLMADKGLDYWRLGLNQAIESMNAFNKKLVDLIPAAKPVVAILERIGNAFIELANSVFSAFEGHDDWGSIFDEIKFGISGFGSSAYNMLPESIRSGIDTARGYLETFGNWLSNFIPQPIKDMVDGVVDGFGKFTNFVAGVADDISTSFSDASPNVDDLSTRVKTFISLVSKRISTSGFSFLGIIDSIKSTFSKLINYFKELNGTGGSFTDLVLKVFKDIYNGVEGWLSNIAGSTDGWISKITGKFASLMESAKGIAAFIRGLFVRDEGDTPGVLNGIANAFDRLKESLNLDSFNPGKIISDIVGKFTGVKDEVESESENVLSDAFDFSGFEVKFPDVGAPFRSFMDSVKTAISEFPTEKVQGIIDMVSQVTTGVLGIASLLTGLKFVNSLANLNNTFSKDGNALADTLDGLAKVLKEGATGIGKAIGEGLTGGATGGIKKIVAAFDPLGKKTASKQFLNIATGIGILAASLWVLSTIPTEDLDKAMNMIARLSIVIGGLTAAFAKINASGDFDFKAIGATFRDIGIAIALVVGSLWALTKITGDDNFEPALNTLIGIVVVMGALIIALSWLSKEGSAGNLKAAGATFVMLAVALNLAMLPLLVLSLLPITMFAEGTSRLAILGTFLVAAVSALAWETKETSPGKLAAAGFVLIALAAALNLAMIPMLVLMLMGDSFGPAFMRLAWLTILLGGAVKFLSWVGQNAGKGVVAASAALILLTVALNLAMLPVLILANAPGDTTSALNTIGGIMLILVVAAAAMGIVGQQAGAIAAGSAALILMSVAVGLMAVIVIALAAVAAMDLDSMAAAVRTLGVIFAGLIVLAAVGGTAGTGMLAFAGALFVLALALIGLWAAIRLFQTGFDWSFIDDLGAGMETEASNIGNSMQGWFTDAISNVISYLQQALPEIISAVTGAVQGAANAIMENWPAIQEGIANIISAIVDFVVTNGPIILSTIGDIIGSVGSFFVDHIDDITGAIGGLIEGAQTFMEEHGQDIIDAVGNIFHNVIDWLATNIPVLLGNIGGWIGQMGMEIWNNRGEILDRVVEIGGNVVQGLIDGAMGLLGNLGQLALDLGGEILNGIRDFLGIHSPSTEMQSIGENVVEGLINGITGFLGNLGEAAISLGSTILEHVTSLPGTLLEKGGEVVGGLVDGIGSGIGNLAQGAANLASTVVGGVQNLGNDLRGKGNEATSNLSSGIEAGAAQTMSVVSKMTMNVMKLMDSLVKEMRNAGTASVKSFADGISIGTPAVGTAMNALLKATTGYAQSMYNNMYSTGRHAVQGFVDGMDSLLGLAQHKVDQLGKLAVQAANKRLEIRSPSRVFKRIGAYVVEGFVIGIDQNAKHAADSASEMAEGTIGSFSNTLSSMSVDIEDILDTDYNPVITPVVNSAEFDSSMDQLSAIMSGGLRSGLNIGDLNYNETFAGKLDGLIDSNREAMQEFTQNAINYDKLGTSVANALIRSGLHVEMDGGEVMGYLAGSIRDVRRMYS